MDWKFVTHHLISGCIPVTVALVLYLAILRVLGKKHTAGHIAALFVFCFYLVGVLTMTGVCIKGSFSPRIVCIPFVDMVRGPVDTILNILLFVPMGIFLPMLYGELDQIGKIAMVGLLVSMSIEIAQMFGTGATDINDLITNTLGACVGYGIYRAVRKAIPESWVAQIQMKGFQCYSEMLIIWLGSLLIMLTIQIDLFHALYTVRVNNADIQIWK